MYRQLIQPIKHIPSSIASIRIQCKECRFSFRPDWTNKRKEPFIPITPYKGPGIWRPYAVEQKCPKCGHGKNLLPIPQKKLRSTYCLFGDEAYREVDDKIIISYSLVGTNSSFIESANNEIREFKNTIFPNRGSDKWKLHMKDIWSYHNRQKSIFNNLSDYEIKNMVDGISHLIRNFEKGFIIYSATSISQRPKKIDKKFLNKKKVEIYSLLIIRVIQELTDQGIKPVFTFDSEKVGDSESIIHEWADRSFMGSQHSLLYTYLSGANVIEKPTFVEPGKFPMLEIADFVAFIVARYCYRKLTKQKIDLDPRLLGKAYYLSFENGGDFVYVYQDRFPWKFFFEENN